MLEVRDIHVEVEIRRRRLKVIDGVSLSLARGETLGIVGESGAGKSMLGNAIAGMLEPPLHIAGGSVTLEGRRIDDLKGEELRAVRGRRIGMVFQDPLTSLNPLFSIGDQLVETITTRLGIGRAEARRRAIALLEATGLPDPAERLGHYPHQFSGGMRQRVVLALALCLDPVLVIADEPTTALDVSVQAQIIRLLDRLCREHGSAVILITHDMGVIAEATERVAVMYAGRIVEIGPTERVIRAPRHPYTRGLMASIPPIDRRPDRLAQIAGSMPRIGTVLPGCPFSPRCPSAVARCHEAIPALAGGNGHLAACWLDEAAS
ncbi:ABC transporter ATP-binding protein [Paralimibaculum aggregatum]|uniref:ABC transporter ATP-binding protein n=1 Tax=Paralimibaculum aggregatum TaxID=3036245 RepID=A0ABQ6LPW8_9RHOB|nr:ABC transporter ATP-binding protein [Limibaculum sp. NKW23]